MDHVNDELAGLPEIVKLGEALLDATLNLGDLCVVVSRERLIHTTKTLRNDPELQYELLLDLCGVDYLKLRSEPRFEVVYHLYSVSRNRNIRLKVPLQSSDLKLPSVVSVWEGANWYEREAWDMFGIVFEGHPFLHRLLCHHEFQGHPLRKDYPINKRQWCDTVWDLEM